MWAMVGVQTIGSVDLPGHGDRKLPAPKQYVAIVVLWGLLGFVADLSAGAARAASALSVLLLLTGMVLGPFGKRFVSFISGVSSLFPVAPQPATTTGTQPTGTQEV